VAEYILKVKPSAAKELDRLPASLFRRVDAKILQLENNPRPPGAAKLKGYAQYWRIRVGDYRVVYRIDDQLREIVVTRIAHRNEVYER
jgi:mRNA interferase RelE/StbE